MNYCSKGVRKKFKEKLQEPAGIRSEGVKWFCGRSVGLVFRRSLVQIAAGSGNFFYGFISHSLKTTSSRIQLGFEPKTYQTPLSHGGFF